MSEGCRAWGSDEIRGRVFSFSGNKEELCEGKVTALAEGQTLRGVKECNKVHVGVVQINRDCSIAMLICFE